MVAIRFISSSRSAESNAHRDRWSDPELVLRFIWGEALYGFAGPEVSVLHLVARDKSVDTAPSLVTVYSLGSEVTRRLMYPG